MANTQQFPKPTKQEEMIVGSWYWIRHNAAPSGEAFRAAMVRQSVNGKYISQERIPCDQNTDLLFTSYEVYGPIPTPLI